MRVDSTKFGNEAHFMSFAAIIATRNGTEGSNFHIRNTMTAIVEVSGNRLVCVVACDRATVLAKPSPQTSSSFSNVKHATSTAWYTVDEMGRGAREMVPCGTRPCGTFPCGVGQCKTCKFIDSSTTISAPKFVYHIKHHFTCTSSHLIYCISCSRCGMLYIGETGRCLRTRFGEHRRSVTSNDANQPVARHFNNGSHCVSDMKIRALCPISGSNDSRKRHEMRLISKLGTVHPHGINERFSYI